MIKNQNDHEQMLRRKIERIKRENGNIAQAQANMRVNNQPKINLNLSLKLTNQCKKN